MKYEDGLWPPPNTIKVACEHGRARQARRKQHEGPHLLVPASWSYGERFLLLIVVLAAVLWMVIL